MSTETTVDAVEILTRLATVALSIETGITHSDECTGSGPDACACGVTTILRDLERAGGIQACIAAVQRAGGTTPPPVPDDAEIERALEESKQRMQARADELDKRRAEARKETRDWFGGQS